MHATTMHDLILHHYPMSPFAEKARLMLGLKDLAWHSVHIPPVMPKPDVVALTGGYRKTPLLQIGADIYCDTALIADVLEHCVAEPPLYPAHARGLSRAVAQWADSSLFWASMGYTLSPKGARALFADQPDQGQAFASDRAAMRHRRHQGGKQRAAGHAAHQVGARRPGMEAEGEQGRQGRHDGAGRAHRQGIGRVQQGGQQRPGKTAGEIDGVVFRRIDLAGSRRRRQQCPARRVREPCFRRGIEQRPLQGPRFQG